MTKDKQDINNSTIKKKKNKKRKRKSVFEPSVQTGKMTDCSNPDSEKKQTMKVEIPVQVLFDSKALKNEIQFYGFLSKHSPDEITVTAEMVNAGLQHLNMNINSFQAISKKWLQKGVWKATGQLNHFELVPEAQITGYTETKPETLIERLNRLNLVPEGYSLQELQRLIQHQVKRCRIQVTDDWLLLRIESLNELSKTQNITKLINTTLLRNYTDVFPEQNSNDKFAGCKEVSPGVFERNKRFETPMEQVMRDTAAFYEGQFGDDDNEHEQKYLSAD